ncbi:hypothetical protein GCM10008018_60440 [Paenibacillus marchantiophytorum]|uniref:Uncharacterized protein n=1 Tax=Paenibacillus marchantiophytorum TaxID=1619310 RepID=A0ABQ1FDY8_9BACL|nr:hypothetical protein [Paenibacillus marchantiophytorum]GGA06484.1 hypothetical protein GCM10008018_60440 [Paenibacillus marchantiophytorum]
MTTAAVITEEDMSIEEMHADITIDSENGTVTATKNTEVTFLTINTGDVERDLDTAMKTCRKAGLSFFVTY